MFIVCICLVFFAFIIYYYCFYFICLWMYCFAWLPGACLPACLLACLPACLPAGSPDCLRACLLAWLLAASTLEKTGMYTCQLKRERVFVFLACTHALQDGKTDHQLIYSHFHSSIMKRTHASTFK